MHEHLVHIVASQPTSVSVIQSAAQEFHPDTRIINHETFEQFKTYCDNLQVVAIEILVTDMQHLNLPLNKRMFYIPVVQFSTTPPDDIRQNSSVNMNASQTVFLGNIGPSIREGLINAQRFLNLRANARRLASLSDRERKVVSLAADGMPNKAIARRLDVSVKTIEKSRRNAYTKLSVSSAAEMASLVTFGRFCDMNPVLEMPTIPIFGTFGANS